VAAAISKEFGENIADSDESHTVNE